MKDAVPPSLPQRIALIGMSGVGKSHWSHQLENLGYTRWSCDELIAEKMRDSGHPDLHSTRDLARWMGHPFEERYATATATYLDWEDQVIVELCRQLQHPEPTRVVVDTTGSLIYLAAERLQSLRRHARMVYLSTAPEQDARMLETFLEDPKPVVWGESFCPEPQEPEEAALERCYPKLLAARRRAYTRLAHTVVDFPTQRCPGFSGTDFLACIQAQLAAQVFS